MIILFKTIYQPTEYCFTWSVFFICSFENMMNVDLSVRCFGDMSVSEYDLESHYDVNEIHPKYTQKGLLKVLFFLVIYIISNCPL